MKELIICVVIGTPIMIAANLINDSFTSGWLSGIVYMAIAISYLEYRIKTRSK